MSTEYTAIDEWSEFTDKHLERFIAFRERMKDREEVLPKPSNMSVEEAFEKTFARFEETFKKLSTK